jgi:O-antigen ligase
LKGLGRLTQRGSAAGLLDGLQSFGLTVLLFGLPFSEALKSLGLALAILGFVGKLALGARPHVVRWATPGALLLFYCAAALSVALADPAFQRPGELLTLAMTVLPFVLVADACARKTRRLLFATAVVLGAVIASLLAFVSHMHGPYIRLVLGSIENAVPAAEYLGAVLVLATAMLGAEFAAPLAGPLWAFAGGSSGLVLLMTQSRGPLLGTLAGLVVTAGSALRRLRHALAFALVAVGAILWFAAANPDARLSEAFSRDSRAVGIRSAVWSMSADRALERPLLGHGLGSYRLLNIVYSDRFGDFHQMNAHSTWLHAVCETGVLGAGTLALFVVLGLAGVARACRSTSGPERAISVGSLGGLVVLLVSGLFSVTTDAEPGMLFFSLMALGGSGVSRGGGGSTGSSADER